MKNGGLMNTKWKIGLIALAVLTFAAMLFTIKYLHNKLESERALKEQVIIEMKRLKGGTVRSEGKYATRNELKDLANKSGVDLKPIEKDIKKLGADIEGISRTVARSVGVSRQRIPSTTIVPREVIPAQPIKTDDVHGYLKNRQVLKLEELFKDKKIPLGEVGFSAWEKNPWDIKFNSREYSIVTVLSTNEDGRHFMHNNFSIEVNGKKRTIELANSKFKELYPEYEFRFNPSLYLGVDGGIYVESPVHWELSPNVQLSLFSYGKTKINSEWSFAGIGIGYASQKNGINFVFSPVNYNIGKNIPIVRNIYVGPAMGLDTSGNFSVLGGIRVGL